MVESISAPLSVVQGAALNFSYVVKNTGGTQAGLNWSGIAIDQQVSETNYQGFDTINSLAAGAAITFNNSISTAGLSVGQHTLYIEATTGTTGSPRATKATTSEPSHST